MSATDRPAAFWLATPADGPEPWSVEGRDTDPAPPPVSATRYAWTAPERATRAPRRCRQTDPCVVPPPGSDRGGDVGARVTVLPPLWGRGGEGGDGDSTKGER